MAEDWDLYAVVRRCTSAANSSRATESNDDSRNENRIRSSSSSREDPLACLASLTFEEEDDPFPFPFPDISQQNGSLQDSYKPFLPNVAANPTTTTTNQPCSSSSLPGGSSGRQQQLHHHQRLQPPEQPTTTANIEIGSPLTPTSAPIFDFSRFTNQQQQSQSPPLIDRLNLPQKQLQQRVQPQAPRSRKRKNQQKRTVCHVTADNLSSDPWAWRKYGQKPIKGSPYPRNYYRCSSTKGCSARKQVERSHLDPNIFIITYTGEHTHPKPTHRNSLAGSTRNKVSTVQKGGATTTAVDTKPTASCSSPPSTASLSPISPTTTLSVPEDAAVAPVNNAEGEEDSIDMAGESDDDDDLILIPNVHVDEDLFKGLDELVGSGGVEPSPTFGDNFSSWSTSDNSTAAASGGC